MCFFVCIVVAFVGILMVESHIITKENLKSINIDNSDIEIDLEYIEKQILKMDGYEFENFMGKLFKLDGYKVVVTPSSNDNGRDIELRKDGLTTFVECKHYTNTSVSSPMINKLVGSCTIFGADKAIFVTTSGYTKAALNLIDNSPIEVERWYLDDILYLCKKKGLKKVIGLL